MYRQKHSTKRDKATEVRDHCLCALAANARGWRPIWSKQGGVLRVLNSESKSMPPRS